MSVKMRRIGPCFAAEVDEIDIRKPLSPDEVTAIHEGMNEYAVLVFPDQDIDGEQHLAFSLSLGELERTVSASLRAPEDYRLPTTFADVSNLDKNEQPFAREDRRRLFAIGNRLWHSDSSFKVVPAKYSLLHARTILPDLLAPADRLLRPHRGGARALQARAPAARADAPGDRTQVAVPGLARGRHRRLARARGATAPA